MDTVTYSEQAVVEAIQGHFVPVQVNTQDKANEALIECYRQVWTPDVRVLDCTGSEAYYWNGYLPPYEFLPKLQAGLAQACLRLGNLDGAAGVYEDLLARFPTSHVAAEARYYLAVAHYKATHSGEALMAGWSKLRAFHPDTIWRVHQSFSEGEPAPHRVHEPSSVTEEVKAPRHKARRG